MTLSSVLCEIEKQQDGEMWVREVKRPSDGQWCWITSHRNYEEAKVANDPMFLDPNFKYRIVLYGRN
jgi:hypothetical protein